MNVRIILLLTALNFVRLSSQTIVYDSQNHFYLYTDVPSNKQIQLWVPSKDSVIRGILVDGNAGTATNSANIKAVQDFAAKFNFAYSVTSGVDGWNTYTVNAKIFTSALKAMAGLGYQPELVNVPIIGFGSSSAGANAYCLENYMPGRNICSTPNVAAFCMGGSYPATTLDSTLLIPTLFTTGSVEGCHTTQQAVVSNARGRNGLWAYAPIQNMAHEHRRTQFLAFRMWEKMIAARVPAGYKPRSGPVALIPYPYDSGWVADQTTFNSGFTVITPKKSYSGSLTTGSWLPDQELAVLYQTLTSYNPPIWMKVEGLPDYPADVPSALAEFKTGDTLNLICDVSKYAKWKKIEFFRGLSKIGEAAHIKGKNDIVVSCLVKLGYESYAQPFYVIGTDSSDVKKTTQLYTVLVFGPGKATGEKTPIAVNTGDAVKPTVPSNVNVVQNSAAHVKIGWTPSTDNNAIKGYEIYQNGKLLMFTTYTLFSIDSLQAGITYGPYKIVSVDLNGNRSDSTSAFSVTTAPTAPTGVVISNITPTSANVSWTASKTAGTIKKYIISGKDVLTGKDTFSFESTTTSVSLTGLNERTFYIFYITAVDANNAVSQAVTAYVSTTKLVGAENISEDAGLSVSPNPASGNVKLHLKDKADITIVDMSGKIVLQKNSVTDGSEINISALAKGYYVIVAKENGRIYHTGLVVE